MYSQKFLKFTEIVILIGIPCLCALAIWGPGGTLTKRYTFLDNWNQSVAKNVTPCIVCGKPGKTRSYRKSGAGVSNPFKYKGPYNYCSVHTKRTPLLPFKYGMELIRKVITFIIAMGIIGLLTSDTFSRRKMSVDEIKESWGLIFTTLISFAIFFFI